MYLSSISLVWGTISFCAGDIGGYGVFWIEESCVGDSMSDVSEGFFSWYISVGFVISMLVVDVELGIGCMYYLFTYMYGIHMD